MMNAPLPASFEQRSRFRGALMGLAAGDAVGTRVEFKRPGTFPPVEEMIGGGPFRLNPGEWTDDTAMALCLAASLVERQVFDPRDQMERYVRWWQDGYMSVRDHCFDIGITTQESLARFLSNGEPYAGSTDPYKAGNGSLMRLAPVPLFFAHDPADAIAYSGASSRTTHAAETAVDACRYLGALIAGAVNGVPKEILLGPRYSPVPGYWQAQPLHPEIDAVALGSFKEKQPPDIKGTGHVVRSLEAAIWAFYHTATFRDGCLKAVNLGDDADTTGAVYGQLAGAFYGVDGIPAHWRLQIAKAALIETLADQLWERFISFQAA